MGLFVRISLYIDDDVNISDMDCFDTIYNNDVTIILCVFALIMLLLEMDKRNFYFYIFLLFYFLLTTNDYRRKLWREILFWEKYIRRAGGVAEISSILAKFN